MTHTTNPLISKTTYKDAISKYIDLLTDSIYDSLFSVNEIQTRLYSNKFLALNHNPEILIPTQELQPIYEENSCIYLFTKKSFQWKIELRKSILIQNTKIRVNYIDTPEDWHIAESIALNRLI